MVKLMINKTRPLTGNSSRQATEITLPPLNDSFLADFQRFSPNLHVFKAIDRDHELRCEMVLEVKESLACWEEGEEGAYLAPIVACSLPSISLQKLNEKTGFDSYLQGVVMFHFQLNILEQLLLFCNQEGADSLILTIHDDMLLDYFEIYSRFLVSEEHVTTAKGEQTQIVIPTDVHVYDEILDFMDKLDNDFRKILWRGQKSNPAFRRYLMSNSSL